MRYLGIQIADRNELDEVYGRLQRADKPVFDEGAVNCYYARSEKSWIEGPQGIEWETFLTSRQSTVYGSDLIKVAAAACCSLKSTHWSAASAVQTSRSLSGR
jgi:hypothetical protein